MDLLSATLVVSLLRVGDFKPCDPYEKFVEHVEMELGQTLKWVGRSPDYLIELRAGENGMWTLIFLKTDNSCLITQGLNSMNWLKTSQ